MIKKKVLITGGNRGLGLELCHTYSKNGYSVVTTVRNSETLQNFLKTNNGSILKDAGVNFYTCDLSNLSEVQGLCSKIGWVDILINCAGIFHVGNLVDCDIDSYNECIAVNLTAPFLLIQQFCPYMIDQKWGRIINIGSSSAYNGSVKTSVYCASKHAILGLSRSLFQELKEYGVRTICVSPGTIKTDMGRSVESLGQEYDTFINPKELAEYILYNSSLDDNMISEEIRLNRVFIQ